MTSTASPAGGEALPKIGDLENPALEAERYASVLYKLIDRSFSESQEEVTGHPNKYWFVDGDLDDIIFIAGLVEVSTRKLNQLLHEVL